MSNNTGDRVGEPVAGVLAAHRIKEQVAGCRNGPAPFTNFGFRRNASSLIAATTVSVRLSV